MDLLDDIKQIIFTYCDWKQYHELCEDNGLQIRLKQLDDLPNIEELCKETKEYLEIVKYLHENGAPITENAINWASLKGHFEIVKYLHENGAPITEYAINWASYNGHLEIVKYLKSVKQT